MAMKAIPAEFVMLLETKHSLEGHRMDELRAVNPPTTSNTSIVYVNIKVVIYMLTLLV